MNVRLIAGLPRGHRVASGTCAAVCVTDWAVDCAADWAVDYVR